MSQPQLPANGASPFEQIRHEDEQGEYWLARELAIALDYTSKDSWRNFERVIKKAIGACTNSDIPTSDHFVESDKMVVLGSGAERKVRDYRLSRYACYLIAQNGDSDKVIVAMAQTYFAVQTRRQELDDDEAAFLEWREHAIAAYVNAGYSVDWATRRVDGIVIRKKLTHEWSIREIDDSEFAILTDQLHTESFGISIEAHKAIKGFDVTFKGKRPKHQGDLRPALTAVELAIVGLGETVARELHINRDSHGFPAIARDVNDAGKLARETRERIEGLTGQPVVSPRNMINEPDGGLWNLPAPEGEG